jgi:hypothetical protein
LRGAIELYGYRLASPVVAPGGSIDVTYVWRAVRPLAGGWRPFVHIEGPGGVWINADHVPVQGLWPVDRWRAGQFVRDHQIIPVPATVRGELTLWVGMFAGGRRLPVTGSAPTDGSQRIRMATVRVGS